MSGERDPNIAEIAVPAQDPEKKVKESEKGNVEEKGKGDKESDASDMSEEDLQLKVELEMLVERLKESDVSLYLPALESLRTLIRTSTSSMTSVPKPLKFLRPHFNDLGKVRDGWNVTLVQERSLLASILSVLAMTYSDTGKRDTLYYRLVSESKEAPGTWGHEYVRHLASELGEEYTASIEDDEEEQEEEIVPNGKRRPKLRDFTIDHLRDLGMELVDFFLKHNAEADAVDLLLELECIGELEDQVDDKSYQRVCQYMVSCVPLLVPPDDEAFLRTAAGIYARHDRYAEALALAIRLHDRALVRQYFEAPVNPVMKKQLAYMMARANVPLYWVHTSESMEPEDPEVAVVPKKGPPPVLSDDLVECLGNQKLSTHFRNFGKAVGVEEPRAVEDIYKTHLDPRSAGMTHDSARQNLASTFVNAFVNAGFGNDKLMVDAPDGQSFIYKNKEHGMMSATASVGLSLLWDHEGGIDHIDKYTYSAEEHIKAGAFLAIGILYTGVRTDPDVCFALLDEHIENPNPQLKIAAINALGMAYAGSERNDISLRLIPYIADEQVPVDIAANAALALAFLYVGSAEGDPAAVLIQTIMERDHLQLQSEWAIFFALALGLIFLDSQEGAEPILETLRAIDNPLARTADILVEVCAYAGTGNVLKVQSMLHICAEKAKSSLRAQENEELAPDGEVEAEGEAENETEGENGNVAEGGPQADATEQQDIDMDAPAPGAPAPPASATLPPTDEDEEPKSVQHQAMAVIGIALIAMGEDVGAEMALRQFQHLMTYGEPVIRKSVPLALALISASNPQLTILDTLSKYSHDSDLEVAANAILAMGLVGAGTNNARLAQMLRQLAVYYAKEPDCLFIVRIAQGFVHMGKGTIGINPYFHDRQILSRTAVAGLLSLLVSFTDAKKFVLGEHHWQLYWLVLAMFPQFLITLDEEGEEKAVTVRVGQAVNTVGLAGTRSGISGFQTHQTPVRIGTGERAELGTNEYFPYSSVLEGFVFIKKNEGYDAED